MGLTTNSSTSLENIRALVDNKNEIKTVLAIDRIEFRM